MTRGPKQLQVLRLLHAHRLMDTEQIKALAFEESSARACQLCLTALHRDGLASRFELHRGGPGGGQSGYVYALSRKGAELVAQRSTGFVRTGDGGTRAGFSQLPSSRSAC